MAAGDWLVLAGGTDIYPAHVDRPISRPVLDISRIAGLRGVSLTGEGWRIGALTTWSDIVRADLPPAFDALKQAAREVGAIQIQNAATVAGNLCNASPAADGVPPLLTLDAEVELESTAGSRRMPLGQFIEGNRKTALRPGELMTAVHVPAAAGTGVGRFEKLGARRYLVISIVMVAVRLVVDKGAITDAAIAVGACSPVARRLGAVEAALKGRPADAGIAETFASAEFDLSPIDDVRASAEYRVDAARELVTRAILRLVEDRP